MQLALFGKPLHTRNYMFERLAINVVMSEKGGVGTRLDIVDLETRGH